MSRLIVMSGLVSIGRICVTLGASVPGDAGLREQPYAVDVARDGEEALYQASITDYDAIVVDVMPRWRACRSTAGTTPKCWASTRRAPSRSVVC